MKLPPSLREQLAERFGTPQTVEPVPGGSINVALRVNTPGRALFAKLRPGAPAGFFAAETRGLEHLRSARSSIHVPEVFGYADADLSGGVPWLLLEWLEPAAQGGPFHEQLASGLAAVHRDRGAGCWGDRQDGYLGTLPQPNEHAGSWAQFWRARRLEPQLQQARAAGWHVGSREQWALLFGQLPRVLAPAEADGPSLLHGDLWSGNVFAIADHVPALVDPAAYWGHREVDLAMAALFGGFARRFFAAYDEAWQLQPGFWQRRCAVYQLYYLLVHVNLFGGSYAAQTRRTLAAALQGEDLS